MIISPGLPELRCEMSGEIEGRSILATGAKGMLGSYFDDRKVFKTDIDDLDIRDRTALEEIFCRLKPSTVLHLGAETDVDMCEDDKDHAFRTNSIGTQNVVQACKRHGTELAYISTGSIFFSTEARLFTEYDTPDPRSLYAASKYEGEKVIREHLSRYYIFRAGWMMGGVEKDRKFVRKVFVRMMEHGKVDVVDDKFGTPVYAKDMTSGIMTLIEDRKRTPMFGTYHLANTGLCSRFDMAVEMARIIHEKTGRSISVSRVSSDRFPLPAPRSTSEGIRNYKLELLGIDLMRPWQDALYDYMANELIPWYKSAAL